MRRFNDLEKRIAQVTKVTDRSGTDAELNSWFQVNYEFGVADEEMGLMTMEVTMTEQAFRLLHPGFSEEDVGEFIVK